MGNTFLNMQEASSEVESNLMASNKLRGKSDHQEDEKKKEKNMLPYPSGTKIADSKIEDMNKLMKSMSAKLNRMEMENKSQNKSIQDNDNKNPNQFRGTFNLRLFPRDRRNNDDHKIQPRFLNNLIRDDESYEIDEMEVEDLEHDID